MSEQNKNKPPRRSRFDPRLLARVRGALNRTEDTGRADKVLRRFSWQEEGGDERVGR